MSRKLLWVVPSLVVCAAAASSDASGQVREVPPLAMPAGTVQVAMGTAAAEAWKTATAGADIKVTAVRTTAPDGKLVVRNVPGRGTLRRFTVRGPIGTSFETDLAPGVTRIAFDPTVVEVIDLTAPSTGPAANAQMYSMGRSLLGNATFTLSPPARAIADWVKAIAMASTTPTRRDVSVTIKGSGLRVITLKGCLPTAYTSNGASAVVTLVPEAVSVSGSTHAGAGEWANATINGLQTAAQLRRDVRILFLDAGGREVSRTTLKSTFVSEIGWSTLDRASGAPVEEWIGLQPEQVDVMP